MPPPGSPRRLVVLAICCMSLFIVGLDNTIVNIALPSIRRELDASVSGLQWTIDGYTLVLASLLLLAGSTADRVGRRRTFQTGLVVFTAGSLLCGLAPSLGWLVAFRVVQAVGGSMLNPVAMSIITNTFTDPGERAKAIGVWGGVVGLSMALGPLLGGWLVQAAGWRTIFWINVPVGVTALVLTARFVPESKARHPRRLDPVGQLLVLVVLAAGTYAIIEGPAAGWLSPVILGCVAGAGTALGALLWYEPRRAEPLIELRLFANPPFAGATAIAVFAFAALGGSLFLNTIYLQEARGLSALHAGLYTLPFAVATGVFAPLSGRIVAGRGPRLPLMLAGVAMATGAVMLTGLDNTTPAGWLIPSYLTFGAGFGLVNAPITNTAVAGLPVSRAGVAAALASTSRQVGQLLGVAVVGSIATARLRAPLPVDFARASHVGWWIVGGCGVAIFVIGALTAGPGLPRERSARP